jgi:hypothetical protein
MAIKDKAASVLVNLKNQAREIGLKNSSSQCLMQLLIKQSFLRVGRIPVIRG